jgi:hypothetical protein
MFDEPVPFDLNDATGPFGGDYTGWAKSFTTIDYVRAWRVKAGQGQVFRH